MTEKVVKSNHNFFSIFLNAIWLILGLAMVYASIFFLLKKEDTVSLILSLSSGVFIFVIALMGSTDRYIISETKFVKTGIFGNNDIDWKDIFEIWIQSTTYGTFVLQLRVKNLKRHIPVALPSIGNRKEVAQAILEAATLSNPDVSIRGWSNAYGSPPFGIFVKKTQ